MKLLLTGDVMLGRLVNENLKIHPPDYPWGDTLPIFKEADVRICNLECVMSSKGSPALKVFTFRSDPNNIAVLEAASINAVSLANNHTLDYGREALADTFVLLEKAGIRYAGAGANLLMAQHPAILEMGSMKIGLLSVTDANETGWEAETDRSGTWYVPVDIGDPRAFDLIERIKETKTAVNILIVALHWGSNWGYEPEPGHREFAHMLIDAGVDIIFGHSCHVFRGIEIYRKKPIIYSAGDFIDDYAVDAIERNDESFIFMIEIFEQSIQNMFLYPTIIKNFQVQLADLSRVIHIASRMKRLCRELGTQTCWNGASGTLDIKIS
ncbi:MULTISPECIES: CapA family protein [Niastella]|uniref:CapA family protein n=1 Tax=Niastella soli TaxID=2821487 RepID=A0ABS3YLW7_9BACT|nr:CapA family protein [Niastella soli]MBO9198889.1 CapA family protein [Niastella soli]